MVDKIKWDDSQFTKMVKEYGDKIAKLSEGESKKLLDQLLNDEAVDLFAADIDKKKLKNKTLNNSIALGASISDAPRVVLADTEDDTEDETEDNKDNNIKEASSLDKDFEEFNFAANFPYENVKPYEEKINNIATQIGKNVQDIAYDFLTKGPGLTDLDLFAGITNIIKEPVNDDFAKIVNDFYEKNSVFNKAYDGLITQLGNEPGNITQILNKVVEDIKQSEGDETKVDQKSLAIFRLLLQLVTVVLHNNYNIIKREYLKTAKNSKIAEALYKFYNDMITIKQANGTLGLKPSVKELITIINGPYTECINSAGIGNVNPLATLFYMLSSAKASGYLLDSKMSNKNKKINILTFINIYEKFKKELLNNNEKIITLPFNKLPETQKDYLTALYKNKKIPDVSVIVKFKSNELNIINNIANVKENDRFNFVINHIQWDKAVKNLKDNTINIKLNNLITSGDFEAFIAYLTQFIPFNDDNIKTFELKR